MRKAEAKDALLVLSQSQQTFRAAESRKAESSKGEWCLQMRGVPFAPNLAHLEYKLVYFLRKKSKLKAALLFLLSLCQLLWILVLNLSLILSVTSNLAFIEMLHSASSLLHWELHSHKRFGHPASYQCELSLWSPYDNFSLHISLFR